MPPQSQHEREEYLNQDEAEAEAAGHRMSVIALAILAVLMIAGVVLANRLREVSAVQDCLMTRATNCNDMISPPIPAGK
jgi:hypothetical protein